MLGECWGLQQAGAEAVDAVMVTWGIAELWDLLSWALPRRLCPSLSVKMM